MIAVEGHVRTSRLCHQVGVDDLELAARRPGWTSDNSRHEANICMAYPLGAVDLDVGVEAFGGEASQWVGFGDDGLFEEPVKSRPRLRALAAVEPEGELVEVVVEVLVADRVVQGAGEPALEQAATRCTPGMTTWAASPGR